MPQLLENSISGLNVLLDASIKSSVILVVVCVAGWLGMKRISAAWRHLIWLLVMVGVLVLPIVTMIMPSMNSCLLPGSVDRESRSVDASKTISADSSSSLRLRDRLAVGNAGMSPVSVRRQSIAAPPVGNRWMRVVEYWPSWVLLVWLMGAGIALFQLPLGVLGIYFLSRRSQHITSGSLGRMLSNVADELGGRRPVTLLIEASGTRVVMPMTWGMLRPVILLPAEVETWAASRLRLVLLHELAHIKRRDCLTQIVAQIAGALFWFNPLMWQAVRQLRMEAEHACDDIVLQAGCTSQDYARHLLQIARHSCVSRYASLAMAPIGRPSKMERRLRSILDAGRRRGEVTRRGLCLASITEACVVSLLASVQFYSVPI